MDIAQGSDFDIFYGDAASAERELVKIKTNANDRKLNTFYFQKHKIYGNIFVRPRNTGDIIRLKRAGNAEAHRKTLKKLFIEYKIPRYKREAIPVIADSEGILAVYGIGQDVRAAADGPGACDKTDDLSALIIEERKSDA